MFWLKTSDTPLRDSSEPLSYRNQIIPPKIDLGIPYTPASTSNVAACATLWWTQSFTVFQIFAISRDRNGIVRHDDELWWCAEFPHGRVVSCMTIDVHLCTLVYILHNVRGVDIDKCERIVLFCALYPLLRLTSIKEVRKACLIYRMVIGMIGN